MTYYNQIFEQQSVDEDGYIEFDQQYLPKMIALIKEKADVDLILEAFYNMIGHKTYFQCKY